MALIPFRPKEVSWNPFHELEQIQQEMNRLFESTGVHLTRKDRNIWDGLWAPAVDVIDSKDSILIKADIPGMNKEDITVSVEADTLLIQGEKKEEKEVKEKNYVRSERFYGSFYRAISLPAGVDTNKVNAVYKNGVLELTLIKKEESKPKQIKVDVQ